MARKKHWGFRIFITLFLLLAAGGALFYFGWVQIQIPEGHFGLIHTKTTGWDERVYSSGEFVWKAEAVFPTNLTLHLLPAEYHYFNYRLSGTLPSGRTYASALEERPDFSYQMEGTLVYRWKPEIIAKKLISGEWASANAEEWYNLTDQTLQEALEEEALRIIMEAEEEPINRETLKAQMREALVFHHTDLALQAFTLNDLRVPDPALYQRSRQLYLSTLEERKAFLLEIEQAELTEEQDRQRKLDLIRHYGEIFSEYPILLDYFQLDPESPLKP